MSSRNDYWAYLCLQNDGLAHHGVKGMKWGVRKDRYESFKTTRLRNKLENKQLSERKRARIYSKYNKAKTHDYNRKIKANAHPSHLRNIGATLVKSMLIGAGISIAAKGAMKLRMSSLGMDEFEYLMAEDYGFMRKVGAGAKIASAATGAQLWYKGIEQSRAIQERKRGGRYDLVRR